jgi:hypothetical protein
MVTAGLGRATALTMRLNMRRFTPTLEPLRWRRETLWTLQEIVTLLD